MNEVKNDMDGYVGSSDSSDVNSDEWKYSPRKKINKLDGNKITCEFSAAKRAKKCKKTAPKKIRKIM